MQDDDGLLIVSNRGPVRFMHDAGGELISKRGGGGLVTALSALAGSRPLTWIASALSDADIEAAADGPIQMDDLRLRLVEHDREEYDRYYNVFANPTLWFIHHYLWGLAQQPSVDRNVRLAWEAGYVPVNERFADAVVEELKHNPAPVMIHDYQLFMVPTFVRERAPDAVLHHFTHIPWPQPDYWRVLPRDIRTALHQSLLACDIVGMHTPRYVESFLECVAAFTDAKVDRENCTVSYEGRTVHVRSYPISVDPQEFERLAGTEAVVESEERVLEARPEKMILRVDRTDPSKNIVRGFRAYDLFLMDHPEWLGRVTMLALLDPSRPDIPEYAEYVGAIQRAAREVNDRHYMTGMWQPIDLRMSDNFPEAVAAYKHYDVLLVNAIFDGMNLIAKEAPLVNERNGVLILSENAGSYYELRDHALVINPFDIQMQADAMYEALKMPEAERRRRIEGIRTQVREHDIKRWIENQLADLDALVPANA